MKSIPFGQRSGLTVTPVSIGAMRLPADFEEAVGLIRHAIDHGLRYIDTSRGYGESEWVLGRALKDGYREKVILSTKSSPWVWKIRSTDEAKADTIRRRIDESLRRLDVSYLDFYQVWNIDSREHYEQAVAPGGMVEGIQKAMAEGLVRHTGFTTHDTVPNLLAYLPAVDWCEVILFTYNLLNRSYAPAIAAAHQLGIGTIIMNPVGGGMLTNASPVLQKLADQVGAASVVDLALRYVLSNPDVDTLISGITRPGDVSSCLACADRPRFTAAERQAIDTVLDGISAAGARFCTGCKYCLPCPRGIDIPAIMNMVFESRHWGFQELARRRYAELKGPKADACSRCGACEKKCTQKLAIMAELAWAAEELRTPS
jgi:predicted aldo/keto reductase-like oxidoreductase